METMEESCQTWTFDSFFILFLIYLILKIKLIIRYREILSVTYLKAIFKNNVKIESVT